MRTGPWHYALALIAVVGAGAPSATGATAQRPSRPSLVLSAGLGVLERGSYRWFANSQGGYTYVIGGTDWGLTMTAGAALPVTSRVGLRGEVSVWRGGRPTETFTSIWLGPAAKFGDRDALRVHAGIGLVNGLVRAGSVCESPCDVVYSDDRTVTGLGVQIVVGYERTMSKWATFHATASWAGARPAVDAGVRVTYEHWAVRLGIGVWPS
jgi:hypothetical protein